MITGVPLINGVAYVHADIKLMFLGAPVIGLKAINYSDLQDITPNYSTGHKPTSVGFGTVKFEGSLTVTMETFQAIKALAPGGRVQNIPFFPIGINYIPEGGIPVRHVLRKCRFKGITVDSQTDNSEIVVPMPLFIADIDLSPGNFLN